VLAQESLLLGPYSLGFREQVPVCLLSFCSNITVHGEDGRDLFLFLCNVSLKTARKIGNDESPEDFKRKSED